MSIQNVLPYLLGFYWWIEPFLRTSFWSYVIKCKIQMTHCPSRFIRSGNFRYKNCILVRNDQQCPYFYFDRIFLMGIIFSFHAMWQVNVQRIRCKIWSHTNTQSHSRNFRCVLDITLQKFEMHGCHWVCVLMIPLGWFH